MMETVHATPKISLFGELVKDVEIRAPAGKFHHMFAARPHHMSKATPNNIQGCDLIEGEWGKVGTIVIWYYFIDGQPKMSKDRIEAGEPEKNLITFRVIEGDLMNEFKSFVLTIQVTPKQGGPGSVVNWHVKYEKIDKNVAHPDNMLPFFESMSKEIDEHLLSEK